MQDPHIHHEEPVYREPVREPTSGLTGYAAIKYGAIIVITLAVLFFLWLVITRFVG
jgi:hypothetical protein